MNYTSYIASTFIEKRLKTTVRTIRLTPKWWRRYHEDMRIMKAQILRNKTCVDEKKETYLLSFPLSIGILKRIIFIRACSNELLCVEGTIDTYFYACTHSPETEKHPLNNIKLDLQHIGPLKKDFSVFHVKGIKEKNERAQNNDPWYHCRPTQNLAEHPLILHALTDKKMVFAPL